MSDTGLGREPGYRDDVELIAVAETRRAALAQLMTPEALARLDAAEAKWTDVVLYGDGDSNAWLVPSGPAGEACAKALRQSMGEHP